MKKKKHPNALPFLFLTEMWERFGFYVVQGLLILYLTKVFNFSDDKSFTIAGLFSALAYVSPMVGGWLADKLLGFRMAIVWGGFFLIVGYAALALPQEQSFYIALAIIIVGNGLFKPNISSLLGVLYEKNEAARDTGFTIFYIGINLGALLAGVTSGFVKDHYGWHAGFLLASLGLIVGLIVFSIGMKVVNMKYPRNHVKKQPILLSKPLLIIYCFLAIAGISLMLQSNFLAKWLLPMLGIFLLIFLFVLTVKQNAEYQKKMLTLVVLIISAIVFWMIFLQMFLSTNLFIDRLINRNVLGFTIPTTAFYSLEAVFIILLGPLFALSWQALNQSHKNPSPIFKFVLGILFAGLGYLVLAIGTYFPNHYSMINPLWIVASYLLITIGELFLSPIGLAAVTILSPPQLTGMMMGIWFMALGFGGQFAGWLAKLSSITPSQSLMEMLNTYRHAFLQYFYLALIISILLFVVHIYFKTRIAYVSSIE